MPTLRERRQRNRRTRKPRWTLWALVGILLALLCGLIGLAIGLAGASTSNRELELPQSVQINGAVLADCAQPKPEDFVSGLENTGISVSFGAEVTNTLETVQVTLTFTKDNATCSRQTTLQRFHLEQKVCVDMEATSIPGIRDFVADASLDAAFVGKTPDQVSLDQCGETVLVIACAGREYEVIYSVEESIAPQATAVRGTAQTGKLPDPATLVTDIVDHSEVTVTYLREPDLTVVGSVDVTLLLTDAYGNTATVDTVIDVIPAANAPQFTGLEDMYIRVGASISYKEGVTAVDPQDGSVTFSVDAAQVDRNTLGEYLVYYSATDSDGNTTIIPRKIIVEDVDRAAVMAYAQAALDKIITDNMSLDRKIQAVYVYTKYNVHYVGTSDKTSILHAAYEGFSTGKGDCYTYYAMNVVLFDLLGLTHLEVTRMGGTSHHWWNLVLHEDGKYYHVDSTPVAVTVEGVKHGKMTDSDLQVYTQDPGVSSRRPNFYVYDKTLPEYEGIEIAP